MKILKLFLAIALAACAFGFQEPGTEGTAEHCDNYHGTAPAHRCMCARAMMCGRNGMGTAEPDAKCKTYCKPDHCHCIGPCTSRRPPGV